MGCRGLSWIGNVSGSFVVDSCAYYLLGPDLHPVMHGTGVVLLYRTFNQALSGPATPSLVY